MTPREFFDLVVAPNCTEATRAQWHVASAVNAVLSLDAFFGQLHCQLHNEQPGSVPARDDEYKDHLAAGSEDFRILRDTAFSLKHGELTGKKVRLVSTADSITSDQPTFADGFFLDLDFLDAPIVFIEVDGQPRRRADFIIGRVRQFAGDQLAVHGK